MKKLLALFFIFGIESIMACPILDPIVSKIEDTASNIVNAKNLNIDLTLEESKMQTLLEEYEYGVTQCYLNKILERK